MRTPMKTLMMAMLAAGTLGTAHAQHVSPEELDRLSAQRQQEIGPRDWGKPIDPPPAAPLHPLPQPATCMSPRTDFEPVYAGPSARSHQIGVAAPQIAVTDTTVAGWTKIIRNATTMAWIPSRDVVPYKPSQADHPTGCKVEGIRDDGVVIFAYPQ